MSSTGLTRPRPKSWCQKRLTIALAKNGLVSPVIHLAMYGRAGSFGLIFGSSPRRNLAGTILADSGRAFFLLGALFDSMTLIATPFLAACCGVAEARVLMKKAAVAQYSVCL